MPKYPRCVAFLVLTTVALRGFAPAAAAGPNDRLFDIPAGDALTTLPQAAEQGSVEILYLPDAVKGIWTHAVKGSMAPRAALEQILAGTGLSVVQDERTAALAVRRETPEDVERKRAPGRSVRGADNSLSVATRTSGEVVQLSPFVVDVSQDRGYLAASALSGTRLNTKIEDIPASLSVITKQQLLDTAAIDINDVFLYEANTEGVYQWTSFNNDRGTVSDDIQANPQGATRMRGLTAANIATGLFPTSLPFDTYNIDSLEISRGPNSSIFGIGNTGGSVNVNQARANLTREITSVTTRGDTYGGYRGSYDLNRPILTDKIAVRILGVYADQGYERKPSTDLTRRQQELITLRPFPTTTIRGSFESYRNQNIRPNSMTPEDGISDWIAGGKPTYNPLTQTVNLANGTSVGPVATAKESTLLPYALAPLSTAFTQYPSWYIENGQIQLAEISQLPSATGTGPNNVSGALHLLQSDTFYDRNTTLYPLFRTPGVTNKALYDWTSINLAEPNYASTKGETSRVELEQTFLNSSVQTLTLQAGWQREHVSTDSRDFLGSFSGGKYEVLVDVNQYLLDGNPNPYFNRPYLGASQPAYSRSYGDSDTFRATLAYELNLADQRNWIKWLGRQRFTGYGEYDAYHSASLGFKDTLVSNEPWQSTNGGPPSSRNSASYRQYLQYYVGDANGYNVDYGAKGIAEPPINTTLRYDNGVTQTWMNDPVTYDQYYYANRPNKRLLSTFGGVWQGFFLDGRIVPTIGMRHDFNRTRDNNSAGNPTTATNGFYDTTQSSLFGAYDWVKDSGDTTSQGVVVKPLNWVHLLYNQSNSFSPSSLAYSVSGAPLPDARGTTRDYGFQFILFHGRLDIRFQQYETVDYGRGSSTINTIVQRTDRMDYGTSGGDPNLTGWLANELLLKYPAESPDQINAQVVQLSGVDPTFIAGHINKTHGDQSIATSRGKEVEIEYNPTRFWTMKVTATQTLAFNGTLSGGVQNYIGQRLPTWTTIRGPYSGALWWTSITGTNLSPQSFYTANVLAPLDLAIDTQGKQITQTREYHFSYLTSYDLAALDLNNGLNSLTIGGAVRWESRASIGYFGAAPDPDGVIRTLDASRPVWDSPHTYVDLFAAYKLSLFKGKIKARIQVNVRNVFERGHLQAVAVNPDGTPWAFRIIDPREAFLSTTFDL